jgi:hypothetical protein
MPYTLAYSDTGDFANKSNNQYQVIQLVFASNARGVLCMLPLS